LQALLRRACSRLGDVIIFPVTLLENNRRRGGLRRGVRDVRAFIWIMLFDDLQPTLHGVVEIIVVVGGCVRCSRFHLDGLFDEL
jgi:hypothetical protein